MKVKTNTNQKRILVVDDIESIRTAISKYLKSYFNVFEAENGKEAISIIENEKIDFVLTDIRMPVMGGLELIRYIQSNHPNIKYALMTAYNVNDYIQYARKEKIWNIIPKSANLNLKHIYIMITKLTEQDIFGVARYFSEIQETITLSNSSLHKMEKGENLFFQHEHLYHTVAKSYDENQMICNRILSILSKKGSPTILRQILEELTSNAFKHGPQMPDGNQSDLKPVSIFFGILEEHVVVAVSDSFGSLNREEVLYHLERQVTPDYQSGLPVGLNDTHGRGLFISRENLDHLIFNIDVGVKTEVIGIYKLKSVVRSHSLSIFQRE